MDVLALNIYITIMMAIQNINLTKTDTTKLGRQGWGVWSSRKQQNFGNGKSVGDF